MARNPKGRRSPNRSGDYEKLDLWDKGAIPRKEHKKQLDVEMISEGAIISGSSLKPNKLKSFRTRLAAEGRENFCEVVVLSVDIRKSSIALLFVEDFPEYTRALTDFICYIKDNWLNNGGGFFDKFTGDGAIFFWPLPEPPTRDHEDDEVGDSGKTLIDDYYDSWNDRIKIAINFSIETTCRFMEIFLPDIRKTCSLIPKNFGLSIGIDAGRCFLTELKSSIEEEAGEDCYVKRYGPIKNPDLDISDDGDKEDERIIVARNVTVIGRPIIGATRMVDAAKPYEILVNSYPGGALKARIDNPNDHTIRENLHFGLELVGRKVKEYCYGPVEAYRVHTDRIEGLKKELGLVEEDKESLTKKEKGSEDTICDKEKKKD